TGRFEVLPLRDRCFGSAHAERPKKHRHPTGRERYYSGSCDSTEGSRWCLSLYPPAHYVVARDGRRSIVHLRTLSSVGTDSRGPRHYCRTDRVHCDRGFRSSCCLEHVVGQSRRQDQRARPDVADLRRYSHRAGRRGLCPKLLAVTRSSSLSWTCSGDLKYDHQPGDHPCCARRYTHRLDRREAIRGASITAVFRALLPGRSISTRVDGSRPGWRSGLRTAVVGVAEIRAVACPIGA